MVIDPSTLEERRVDGPQMWLPVVDPDRSSAVVWYGTLEHEGLLPAPRTGALYLVDWSSLDPYGPSAEQPVDSPPPDGEQTPAPTPAPDQPGGPDATQAPTGPDSSPGADSSLTPDADKLQRSDRTDTPSTGVAAAPDATVPDTLSPIDPGRDPVAEPVLDWQVRWSTDGRVLGVWFADVQNASWGQLELLAIEPGAHQVGRWVGLHGSAACQARLHAGSQPSRFRCRDRRPGRRAARSNLGQRRCRRDVAAIAADPRGLARVLALAGPFRSRPARRLRPPPSSLTACDEPPDHDLRRRAPRPCAHQPRDR